MTTAGDPRIVQNVTATAGYAYGAIGADIHVLGDGTPLYVLENHHSAPTPDAAWLIEVPSRMLNTRFAVVDFTGRETELTALNDWRIGPGMRLAAHWLHAPGGQGKTRLADQLAATSTAAGWKVVTATHGHATALPAPGSQDLSLNDATGLLLLVDYADRWPPSHLKWLFSNALLHQVGMRTRILMLARTAAWQSVRGELEKHQAGTSQQALAPLTAEPGDRDRMFTAACNGFAVHYGFSDPDLIGPPCSLEHPDFGLTLAIHMAALVAIDANIRGRQPPDDMAGLTRYLIDREHNHWDRLYTNRAHDNHPTGLDYQTPPTVMAQAVFTAALTGPIDHATGKAVLASLDLESHPERILTDHARCYPPTESTASVLEPLHPDRLAEDYLALTMPGHLADHPSQPWAPSIGMSLLDHSTIRTPIGWIPRAVTFLAAATQRWPHVGEQFLYPLIRNDPHLALDAGSAAMTALADAAAVAIDVLEAIERTAPDGRHVDLDVGIAAVTQRLTKHWLTQTSDPATRARLYDKLSHRLSNAGRWEEAQAATAEIVEIYRHLARSSVAEADLARSLNNLGMVLSELGRRDEALAAATESVTILRRLAKTSPAAFESNLAWSLMSLGNQLSENGQPRNALSPNTEAVEIFRRLAAADPAEFDLPLTGALTNLSMALSDQGRQREAVDVAAESVQTFRRLVRVNPTALEPDLALALTNLGNRLSNVDRWQEAVDAIVEAVQILRRLARSNPTAYEPGLAKSLTNLGLCLSDVGKWHEALDVTAEAVEINRSLASRNPAAFEPDLALSLGNFGVGLAGQGRAEDALVSFAEAVDIRRRLAKASPAAFEPDLAASLANLGLSLSELGRSEEALLATTECERIFRQLSGRRR
jgi:tetratricopeptide (TPR) repeat protein